MVALSAADFTRSSLSLPEISDDAVGVVADATGYHKIPLNLRVHQTASGRGRRFNPCADTGSPGAQGNVAQHQAQRPGRTEGNGYFTVTGACPHPLLTWLLSVRRGCRVQWGNILPNRQCQFEKIARRLPTYDPIDEI